jgi:hypothetical protein
VGVWLDPSVNYSFSCPAVGSVMQAIPDGKSMVRVMTEGVNLTFNTGYDGGTANNRPFPPNIAWLNSFSANDGGSSTPMACQSAGGTGAVYLTGTH